MTYPELPFNLVNTWYSSCLFIDYLERRKGLSWIAALWKSATPSITDDPWHAIRRTFGADIFLRFSCDAYFLGDPKNVLYSPDIVQRLGQRAPENVYRHTTRGPVTGTVYDFGCRYYAIQPKRHGRIQLRFTAKDTTVRASLAGATADYHQTGKQVRLSSAVTTVDTAPYPNVDHYVLVVTTAPEASHTADLPRPHEFEFEVS